MRLRRVGTVVLAVVAATLATVPLDPAGAADLRSTSVSSATNGVVLGPDGNLWVAEQFADSVARVTPSGLLLDRFPLGAGAAPTTVTTGPGGRVWVAATGTRRLVWFDAASPAPSAHPSPQTTCGPVGLVAGGNGLIFMSLPSDGTCNGGVGTVASIADTGLGAVTTSSATVGSVFDLAVSAGKLFAPDFDGAMIRRLSLTAAPAVDSTYSVQPGSGPNGIVADPVGNLWVTLRGTGKVARFPAAQSGGAAAEIAPAGGMLTSPAGIEVGDDGRIYVAGSDSADILRLDPDGTNPRFFSVPGEPFMITRGPDRDLYVTDRASPRLTRFVSAAPRAATAPAAAMSSSSAVARASVDPRGNATQVVFDYGTTAAYGLTSAPVSVPSGTAPVEVAAPLLGLAGGTAYHVRVRAINDEGTTSGADTTFVTSPSKVAARAKVTFPKGAKGAVVVARLTVSRLTGGETVQVTCSGGGCPFAKQTAKKIKKAKVSFGRSVWKGHRLAPGAKVTVKVARPGSVSTRTVLTVRAGKTPKIVTG